MTVTAPVHVKRLITILIRRHICTYQYNLASQYTPNSLRHVSNTHSKLLNQARSQLSVYEGTQKYQIHCAVIHRA